jgi:serine phosphatase RsbU (regulator of sigma subunit)/catechol 2,3-dioxygenase-like lactoylglutathione lyase family enzyme
VNNDANMAPDDPPAAGDAPSLRLHAVTLFVEDRGASVRFFVDALGFALLSGGGGAGEPSWVAVAPPDGTALLSLVERPGQMSAADAPPIVLLTNDVPARYEAWRRRGVHFSQPPVSGAWGGAHAVFEDPDGHVFTLASVDPLTRELDAARRSTAEREERERRAAYHLRLAAEVQARLLPYAPPPLRRLDYAGSCRQARRVGGDYYDFLRVAEERVALVLADVLGKGMPAALLMASLQANLRAACLESPGDPARVLTRVNARFLDASPSSAYASLIYLDYDDGTRRLRYANCGHPPALLFRRDGEVESLAATGMVLGLFDEWRCTIAETRLEPGDRLVVYSDGVTEALDDAGGEFGEGRLIDAIHRAAPLPAADLVQSVVTEVLGFGTGEQYDDVTLIAAVVL